MRYKKHLIHLSSSVGLALALWLALAGMALAQDPIHVTTTGDPAADGSDWTTNATTLQDALSIANPGDEIWVATGVYTPGIAQHHHFPLSSGIQLYGGFAGTEASRAERDWVANPTILSADITGNDINTDGNFIAESPLDVQTPNNQNIIYADGSSNPITATTVVDGFTLTGVGDGSAFVCYGDYGECSPTLSNLTFSGNYDPGGGGSGLLIRGGIGIASPILTNVIFSGNRAATGGALYTVVSDGGYSSPRLTNVLFYGNYADYGGAIANGASDTTGTGGIIDLRLTNVTIASNEVVNGGKGGAIYNAVSSPTSASAANVYLTNAILWGNGGSVASTGKQLYNDGGGTTVLSYTLIQSGTDHIVNANGASTTFEPGVITSDPQFVSPITATAAPTSTGNYRLMDTSPAIDMGLNSAITGFSTDLDGYIRIQGNAVDLGAYEYGGAIASSICPGGVCAPALWLKANAGTSSVVSGTAVSQWDDQSGLNNHVTAPSSREPTYTDAGTAYNFNPAVTFDAAQTDIMSTTTVLPEDSPGAVFAVASPTAIGGWRTIVGFDNTNLDGDAPFCGLNDDGHASLYFDLSSPLSTAYPAPVSIGRSNLLGWTWNHGPNATTSIRMNGGVATETTMDADVDNQAGYRTVIGGDFQDAELLDGDIAEAIVYTSVPTAEEIQRIESYLALKYGVTLTATQGISYMLSNGAVAWDATANATFHHDVAGVVIDHGSALTQTTSRSVNDDSVLVVELTDNLIDGATLIWGNDNGGLTASNDVPSGYENRLERVWKLEALTEGSATISFDLSNIL